MARVLCKYGPDTVLHNGVQAFTTPVADDTGADITAMAEPSGGAHPRLIAIMFRADAACVIAGPIALFETRPDGTCVQAGLLNDGADIIIPNSHCGIEFETQCGPATKMQVAPAPTAANPTGSTSTPTNAAHVTVKATPIYEVFA